MESMKKMVMETASINTGVVRHLGIIDYLLFALTMIGSAAIGIYFGIIDRRRQTTDTFLLGGRQVQVFPVAMSLVVGFTSSMTILGNPAEMYVYHTMYWWIIVGMFLAVVLSAETFMPTLYNTGVASTFEYLEMRFSKPVRTLAACTLLLQAMMNMSFLLYSPALALNAATGLNLWGCVVGMGVVASFYTCLGGIKAVVWTDTFQAAIIYAGLLAVIVQGCIVEGGFSNAWEIASNRSRVLLDDFSVDPRTRHSAWSVAIGGMWFWVYLYGINQAQLARCLACPSANKARLAMYINIPGLLLAISMCCVIGILMFAFYVDCDPIKYGLVSKTDQLVPLYVMDILGHVDGMAGIFVSCVISGSLSSISTCLNAVSAVIFCDIIQSFKLLQSISEFRSTIISKLIVAASGLLAIALSVVVAQMGGVLQGMYVAFGILCGPVTGVFTLGMIFPWANKWGALIGTVVSLLFLFWVGVGAVVAKVQTPPTYVLDVACNWTARPTLPPPLLFSNVTDAPAESSAGILEPLYQVSYLWYTWIGTIVCWVVGLIVSAITGFTDPKSLDPRLICPIFDKLFPYLPEKILKPLRFGIVHKGKYNRKYPINGYAKPETEPEANELTNGHARENGFENGFEPANVGEEEITFEISRGDDVLHKIKLPEA